MERSVGAVENSHMKELFVTSTMRTTLAPQPLDGSQDVRRHPAEDELRVPPPLQPRRSLKQQGRLLLRRRDGPTETRVGAPPTGTQPKEAPAHTSAEEPLSGYQRVGQCPWRAVTQRQLNWLCSAFSGMPVGGMC